VFLKNFFDRCFDIADKRGIRVIWGFTLQDEVFRRSGFNIAGKLKYAILTVNCFQTYRLNRNKMPKIFKADVFLPIVKNIAIFFFVMFSFLQSKSKLKKNASFHNFRIEAVLKDDVRLNNFWRSYGQKKHFITIARTSRYLSWRVFENPNLSSRMIAATINGEIFGYIIVSLNNNHNTGMITDLCVLDNHSDEITSILMNNATEYLKSQGAALL